MITVFIDPKIKKLISEICSEHQKVSGSMDSNIGYLWHLYDSGMKKGIYKPFIFLSELNLLVKTGYVTEDEKQNMLGMLLSADEDNTYLVAYSILTLRTARIKDLGLWVPVNEKYSEIDYSRDIINTQMFNKL
tara:strand:+ start:624 stop:1022 length:399 start_codon:yes stop_codon:yes gene_type:complete